MQFGRSILRCGVNVNLRAELFSERAFVGTPRNSHSAVAAFGRVLHAEMAETTDAEDGDGVAGARTAVAECVVGCNTSAEKRPGVNVREVAWNEGEGVGRGDDVVGVPAVEADAGDELIFAEREVAATAGCAEVAVAAMPAEADALANFKERDVGADGIDDAGHLMAGNTRVSEAGPIAELGERIAVANAAGLNANANVAGAGIGKLLLDKFECSAGSGNLHGSASH